jgi:hypothetical protein
MEKELMKTGVPNMLQCTQDLVLKSYVASHYAAHQLGIEASSHSHESELEVKNATVEREKLELQKTCEPKHNQLATIRAKADAALTQSKKYSDEFAKV